MQNQLTPESFKQRTMAAHPEYAKAVANDGTPYTTMDATDFTKRFAQKYPDAITSDGHKYADFLPPAAPVAEAQPKEAGLGEQLAGRVAQGSKALTDTLGGKINPLSGLIQGVGAVAGGVNDVVGKGLELIPGVKQAEGLLGKGIGALANTSAGQKVVGGVNKFKQAHPELSDDIAAGGNIIGALGLASGVGAAKEAIGTGIARGLGKDAISEIAADLSPKLTAKTAAKAVAKRGTEKTLITGTISPTIDKSVSSSAEVVSKYIPDYMKIGTYSDKVNALRSKIGDVAQNLRTNLKGDVRPLLTPDDLKVLKTGIDEQIASNPLLTGDAGEKANRIFNQFLKYLPQGKDITMEDVLNARQSVDDWIQNIKGGTVFDPNTENAFSVGLRAVRQGANNLMEQKVPDAGVKALLRDQTLLYNAIDSIAPKAVKELGSSRVSRLIAKHPIATSAIKAGLKYGIEGTTAGLVGGGAYSLLKGD